MSSRATPPSESDEEFLDRALDRALEALEDGEEPTVEDLLEEREHLRAEVDSVLRMASQLAQPRPASFPRVRGYTLVAELGRGGMGAVYLAQQEALGGRRVAVKILPAGAGTHARSRERFLREARALASLRHPHVVTVHDVIAEDGCWAYAMEWVDGPSLAQIIDLLEARRERDGDSRAALAHVRSFLGDVERVAGETYPIFVCRIGVAVARALGELHRAGLVHRDVKPSNVLLRRDGTPLLSDFGLVHAVDESLTASGFSGTVAYAPPEQLAGDSDRLDARSDVYSLGVTLYRALALCMPFDGRRGKAGSTRTPAGMLRLIEGGRSVPLRARKKSLPRDLETIVGKAIEVEPRRRYASADELADDLERMLSLQPIRARPAGAVTRGIKFLRRHRGPTLGIAAGSTVSLGLALAVVVYLFFVPRWVEDHVREARLALMDPMQANLLFNNVYWGEQWQGDAEEYRPERAGLRAAVQHYDLALRWAPFDEAIRLERDVVRAVLGAARATEFSSPAAPDDLRSAGLAAYLFGDVESALRSWERFDGSLDPTAASDPLVETGLGILYLVREEDARAYPRLRVACEAFADVGFLTSYLADAALRCGDADVAERLLDAAARMPRQDPQLALNRIRADLLAARGRDSEAETLYRRSPSGTPAHLHLARFLHARGRVEEALDQYVVVVSSMRGAIVRAEYARVLEAWWAALGPEERSQRIRGTVGRSPWDPRSLVARLRYYLDGAEPEDARPSRSLETFGLAGLRRVFDVDECAHWSGIADYPPLLVSAERWVLGSPWRAALSLLVSQLAAVYELVRSGARERVASLPSGVSACPDVPCFQGLGDLPGGGFRSFVSCVSADGSAVGGSSATDHQRSYSQPIVWRAETGMVPLGTRDSGHVFALSRDGSIAVGRTITASMVEQAFRWSRGEGLVGLYASDDAPTVAYSVSDDGLLVAGQSCAEWRNASTWSPDRGWVRLGTGVELTSIVTGLSRDGRWAAGYVKSLFDAPRQAARWSASGGEQLLLGRPSRATAVSDSGTVVGCFGYDDATEREVVPEAMCWTGDAPARSLGDLEGGRLDSAAEAILRDGTWIAGHGTSDLGSEAVLWDEHRRLYRLKDILDACGADMPAGWVLTTGNGIVRNGDLLTICGNGTNPAGDEEAWIARFRVSTAPDLR